MNQCWMCNKEHLVPEGEIGKCANCGVDIDRVPYKPNEKGGDMGELKDRARAKSPFIRLAIGEESEPMTYKSWREVTGTYGDSFRYTFEVATPTGLIQKSFDCPQQKFAEMMDAIEFGSKVVIHRKQKVDAAGNAIEGKSIYEVTQVE